MDQVMRDKITKILEGAVASLDPRDRAMRIRAIKTGNAPVGVYAKVEGEAVWFTWADKPLAVVKRELLADPDITADDLPEMEFIPLPPDTVPDEWVEE